MRPLLLVTQGYSPKSGTDHHHKNVDENKRQKLFLKKKYVVFFKLLICRFYRVGGALGLNGPLFVLEWRRDQ